MSPPASGGRNEADRAQPVLITPEMSAVRSAVIAVRGGDREAFGRLVELYQRRLFGLTLMMVRDPAGAEEVTQDAFVRAFTHLDLFDERRPFYPWLATIAVRLAQTWLRRHARVTTREGTRLDSGRDPAATTADPFGQLITDERSRSLWRSVAALPSGERTAAFLYYRQEMKVGDIARALGVTSGTVKTLLFRARRRLRRTLNQDLRPAPGGTDMTSKHVLTLIEALPLAEYTRQELAVAERHAQDCIECRQALADATWLDSELGRQPEPVPPAGLAAAIVARTARLDEEAPPASGDQLRVPVAEAGSDRLSWAATLAGLALGLGVQAYGLLSGASTLDSTSSRIGGGTNGLIEMPDPGTSVIVLAAGLLLYLAGFFGPVDGTDTSRLPPAR